MIQCSTNNVDQNQPKDIQIMKLEKIFTKKHFKINTIITDMLPRQKIYSFQRTKINEANQFLKTEFQSLPQNKFLGSG